MKQKLKKLQAKPLRLQADDFERSGRVAAFTKWHDHVEAHGWHLGSDDDDATVALAEYAAAETLFDLGVAETFAEASSSIANLEEAVGRRVAVVYYDKEIQSMAVYGGTLAVHTKGKLNVLYDTEMVHELEPHLRALDNGTQLIRFTSAVELIDLNDAPAMLILPTEDKVPLRAEQVRNHARLTLVTSRCITIAISP